MKYVALAFVLSLVILQISAQGETASQTPVSQPTQNNDFGSMLPLLALSGGAGDRFRNLMMYRMFMNPQSNTGNMFNPLLFSNMLGLEFGLF